jgi:hypothetical protein
VKGQQDDKHHQKPLDIFATMNIQADLYADEAMENGTDYIYGDILHLDYEIWQLRINGRKICKNIDGNIRHHIHLPAIADYWEKKRRINADHFQDVAWISLKKK